MDDETKRYRRSKATETTLRQFLNTDGPKGTTEKYRDNFDRSFGKTELLVRPAQCDRCPYIANTVAEIHWHEERNPGHDVCPDNTP